MREIEYSRISKNDIEMCANLYQKVFAEEPWLESFDNENVKRYFAYCCENRLYGGYIAKSNDVFYGLITYFIKPSSSGNVLYIDELCVKHECRNQGIGSYLIKMVEKLVNSKSIISILIHTDKDSDAYKLYENLGYNSDDCVVALYKNY